MRAHRLCEHGSSIFSLLEKRVKVAKIPLLASPAYVLSAKFLCFLGDAALQSP